jgi:hypothetical protein
MGPATEIDVRPTLLHAEIDDAGLHLRTRLDGHGNARIREVVTALLGHCPPERAFVRTRLLHRREGDLVPLSSLGPCRRPPPRPRSRPAAEPPAATTPS